jgi:hypothetical protein
MFDEVRQNVREMLEVGAIRESASPYSSNLMSHDLHLVQSTNSTFRFQIYYLGSHI